MPIRVLSRQAGFGGGVLFPGIGSYPNREELAQTFGGAGGRGPAVDLGRAGGVGDEDRLVARALGFVAPVRGAVAEGNGTEPRRQRALAPKAGFGGNRHGLSRHFPIRA